jgi:hypothetical protein
MPINASAEFNALQAIIARTKNKEEKLKLLIRLLALAPTHKGAEKLRSDIKSRIAKLKKEIEHKKEKRKKLMSHKGITKQGIQIAIYGKTNSGKSLLLSRMTNAKPRVADYEFTTTQPEVGMFNFNNIDFQFIELPALIFNEHDRRWLAFLQTCDLVLILSCNIQDIRQIIDYIKNYFNIYGIKKKMIGIVNQQGTIEEKAKNNICGVNYIICDINTCNIKIIKKFIFSGLKLYRIYLKPPNKKQPDEKPLVFIFQPTVQAVLDELHKTKMKNAKVYGSSSKFDGQSVSLNHLLNDKDIIDFYFD